MPEWLQHYVPDGWSSRDLLIATASFTILSAIGSLCLVSWVIVRLPVDYFINDRSAERWEQRHPFIRWPIAILQHVVGFALILIGIVMSLPGVPGQGLLTIFIGLMLVHFPGKKRVERWVLRRPAVRLAMAKLRTRFGKEPLQLDEIPPER